MTDLIERENPEAKEAAQGLGYDDYRNVVDELSPAFRKTGIVEPGGFGRAMRDPRTVKLDIGGSVELPLLTPIEYVAGYDVDRSKALAANSNVMVMSLPPAALIGQDAQIKPVSKDAEGMPPAIIVETDHHETKDVKQVLPELLQPIGDYEVREFLDERIKNPEGQPASMSFYSSRFVAIGENGEPLPATGKNFHEAFHELETEGHPLTEHTKLLDVHRLREDERLMDRLWDVCKERFRWLGEYHPVSMEDTRDFFMQVVHNENTHTLERYDEGGKPAVGFFMSRLDECRWMKKSFRDSVTTKEDEQTLFFYGIAGAGSAHYGKDIMQTLARTAQKMGGMHQITFESTNMSSRYIPRMVGAYAGHGAGVEMIEPPHKLAQIDYWYLEPTKTS